MLYPIALIYGLVTAIRNFLFDKKYLGSVRFDFPVIGVGNLSVGGTGKSPHVEYLISLLQYHFKVATLSRGYGRTSHGYLEADANSTALQIGDEPFQFKKKYPDTLVTVCEDRVLAVPKILQEHPEAEVLLLDDAFQHRSIRAGLSVLLTEYSNRFTQDEVLPVGWLREARSNYHRADIIIVTKCPHNISLEERAKIVEEIKPFHYQKVYFSSVQYAPLYSFYDAQQKFELNKETDVLLVCGIANPEGLKNYLKPKAKNVYVRRYRDHHRFESIDLEAIQETFKNLGEGNKIMVTTEKDAARLEQFRSWFYENKISVFVQPIAVEFLFDNKEKFDADIFAYVQHYKDKVLPEG